MLYTFFLLFHPNKTKAHGSHSSYLFSWFGYIHSYSVLSLSRFATLFFAASVNTCHVLLCARCTHDVLYSDEAVSLPKMAHMNIISFAFSTSIASKVRACTLFLFWHLSILFAPELFFLFFFFLLLSLHRHTSIYFLYIYRKYRINRNICTIRNDLEWEWMREREMVMPRW